ncbi:MAG: hypothetical protein PHV20_02345 [Bacteroidales bacterium]|nr:hypothetical protein [Bacteroidales bacterium]
MRIIAFTIALIITLSLSAQSKQSVFAELGGQGMSFTFNYDTRISGNEDGSGIRIGGSYIKTAKLDFLRIPVGFNYLIGQDGKFLELGIGATFGNSEILDSGSNTVGTLCIGYRVQPTEGGLGYHVGLTPYFSFGDKGVFIPYFGGVSVAYCF